MPRPIVLVACLLLSASLVSLDMGVLGSKASSASTLASTLNDESTQPANTTYLERESIFLDAHDIKARVDRGEIVSLPLGAWEEVKLWRESRRAPDYRAILILDGVETEIDVPVTTYRGHLIRDPSVKVSAALDGRTVHAFSMGSSRGYFVEPVDNQSGLHYSYEGSATPKPAEPSVQPPDTVLEAGVRKLAASLGHLLDVVIPTARGQASPLQARIQVVGDSEFTSSMGGGTGCAVRMEQLLDAVSLIVESQLNFGLIVDSARCYGTAGGGGLTSTDGLTLACQFHKLQEGSQFCDFPSVQPIRAAPTSWHAAHLFTGKQLDGWTFGVADEPSAIGNAERGAGTHWAYSHHQTVADFSGGYFATDDHQIYATAHEIGHNFGGHHDHAAEWRCSSDPFMLSYCQTIMHVWCCGQNILQYSDGTQQSGKNNVLRMTTHAPYVLTPPAAASAPSGPTSATAWVGVTYCTQAVHPHSSVRYNFFFSDGETESSDVVPSGTSACATHEWETGGQHTVYARAQAHGRHGAQGPPSPAMSVSVAPPPCHLQNGAYQCYDTTPWRGLRLVGTPSGRISELCVWGQTPGTTARVAVRPWGGTDALASTTIPISTSGARACGLVWADWAGGDMLVYITGGDAAIGYESGSPPNGYASFDSGITWAQERWRRGLSATVTSGPPPNGDLENGGDSNVWDAHSFRGKFFQNVASGILTEACIWGQSAGTNATIAIKPTPDSSAPTLRTTIVVAVPSTWSCNPLNHAWNSNTLFVYKESGTAGIGTDQGSPGDSWYSVNSGSTWNQDGGRRGFRLTIT